MTTWIHLSDLQIGQSSAADASAAQAVEMAVARKPDFVVDTGDCVHGAVDDTAEEKERVKTLWAGYRKVVRPILKACPLFQVPGNHDCTGSTSSIATFLRQTGRTGKPPWFAATVKGVHLVGLDLTPERHTGGFLPASPQGRWFRRHLARPRRARCIVVAGHYPIFAPPDLVEDDRLHFHEPSSGRGPFLPLLDDASVDLYLCGHYHSYERCRYRRLTQVMPACHGPALKFMQSGASRYRRAIDNSERRSFTCFRLDGDRLHGEAVAVDGEIIDRWWQKPSR